MTEPFIKMKLFCKLFLEIYSKDLGAESCRHGTKRWTTTLLLGLVFSLDLLTQKSRITPDCCFHRQATQNVYK